VLTKLTPINREVKSESGTSKQSAGAPCRAWRAMGECCSAAPTWVRLGFETAT